MALAVKDLALFLLWLRSPLWCRFNYWPGNFHILWAWPKKKKKTNKNKQKNLLHIQTSKLTVWGVSVCAVGVTGGRWYINNGFSG